MITLGLMVLLRRDRLLPATESAPPGTSARISDGTGFPVWLRLGQELKPLYEVPRLLVNNRESSVLSSSEEFLSTGLRFTRDGVPNCIMAFSKGEKNSSDGADLTLKLSAGCSMIINFF